MESNDLQTQSFLIDHANSRIKKIALSQKGVLAMPAGNSKVTLEDLTRLQSMYQRPLEDEEASPTIKEYLGKMAERSTEENLAWLLKENNYSYQDLSGDL